MSDTIPVVRKHDPVLKWLSAAMVRPGGYIRKARLKEQYEARRNSAVFDFPYRGANGTIDYSDSDSIFIDGKEISTLSTLTLSSDLQTMLQEQGFTTPTLYELGVHDGKVFTLSAESAGVSIQGGMNRTTLRLFLTSDGTAGFGVKYDGQIVAVFSKAPEAYLSMLLSAVVVGGAWMELPSDPQLSQACEVAGFQSPLDTSYLRRRLFRKTPAQRTEFASFMLFPLLPVGTPLAAQVEEEAVESNTVASPEAHEDTTKGNEVEGDEFLDTNAIPVVPTGDDSSDDDDVISFF